MAADHAAGRLVALDAFRGFAIAAMVLVNNPGDWGHLYKQLAHAEWNGWTFTDWIFPFFLFACGVSMTLSLARRAAGGKRVDRAATLRTLLRRAAIIFAIGLVLNFVPAFDPATVRIPGVLQRIALCVALGAPLAIWCNSRQQLWCVAALLSVYAAIMLWVPVPDATGRIAAGLLEPGRDAGAFVDRLLFGPHLWSQSKTWDPEGLLSTLPALGTLVSGVLLGRWLLTARPPADKTVWMLLAGLCCLLVGAILDVVLMPINKNLWTPSYCIFMDGWSLLVFAAFYWFIDGTENAALKERARRLLLPLTIYGMNALFIFALSGLVARLFGAVRVASGSGDIVTLKAMLFAPIAALPLAPVAASLLFAVLFDAAMFAVAWWLWKKRWFVKV